MKKSITIHAPLEKIYAFMDDPKNLTKIWPSMVEVRDTRPSDKGGFDFGWVYKMGGVRFEGASVVVEHIPCAHTVVKSVKGIPSTFVWDYRAEGGETHVDMEVEYTVPIPLLGKLAEAIIVKQNDEEGDTLLANLKKLMEA